MSSGGIPPVRLSRASGRLADCGTCWDATEVALRLLESRLRPVARKQHNQPQRKTDPGNETRDQQLIPSRHDATTKREDCPNHGCRDIEHPKPAAVFRRPQVLQRRWRLSDRRPVAWVVAVVGPLAIFGQRVGRFGWEAGATFCHRRYCLYRLIVPVSSRRVDLPTESQTPRQAASPCRFPQRSADPARDHFQTPADARRGPETRAPREPVPLP